MPLESVEFIEDLTASWPTGTDPKNEGDNHLRNIKAGIQNSFPNTSGAWSTTDQISMGGADMTGARVEGVANPVDGTDAVNLDTLHERAPGHISWGAVGGDGTNGNTPGSGDWSVVRVDVGTYDILFTRAVSGAGSVNMGVSITPLNATQDITATTQGDANRVTLHVFTLKNGQPSDSQFTFIRMVD